MHNTRLEIVKQYWMYT